MENSDSGKFRHIYLAVVLIAAAIYLGCILSPPSLMDDVDAVQAQIARNMLSSGDWVTPARLDGVILSRKIATHLLADRHFVQDLRPIRLGGAHSDGIVLHRSGVAHRGLRNVGIRQTGRFYAGLAISTCIGLFLFTRILIPDVMLTASIALSMWSFLRVLDEDEPHPHLWAALMAASLGVGLILKSTVALLFPGAAAGIYLLLTHQLFSLRTWKRLRPWSGLAILLLIAVPWHVLAAVRNPPIWDFTLRSVPGEYHGFLWFFFMNEQVLRFLNLRSPRDYNTVPRLYFWLFHLLWLFPWSVYFPALARLSYRPLDRAGKTRLLALCWTGFLLVFFTFSTTQEYYSMPCYPALALLLGSAMAAGGNLDPLGYTARSPPWRPVPPSPASRF